jgi:hypothetical protein
LAFAAPGQLGGALDRLACAAQRDDALMGGGIGYSPANGRGSSRVWSCACIAPHQDVKGAFCHVVLRSQPRAPDRGAKVKDASFLLAVTTSGNVSCEISAAFGITGQKTNEAGRDAPKNLGVIRSCFWFSSLHAAAFRFVEAWREPRRFSEGYIRLRK